MKDALIVSAVRTAVGKAPNGALRSTRPDDLGAMAVRGVLDRIPQLDVKRIEDVIIGCAMPEAEQGLNLARIISLRAGLPVEASAMTINRYCASGLQAIALAAERIRCGSAEAIVAGGAESMSMIPMGGNKIAANPWLVEHYPDSYMSMGLTAERVAKHYGISREESDRFALASHQKALAAIREGRFDNEIVPVTVTISDSRAGDVPVQREVEFRVDEGPRADTSYEALEKLRPVFHAHGTVTAGNSSQTSDGAAAAAVVSEEIAVSFGLKPLARLVAFATAGCLPEEMGVGPVYAIPKALKQAGLTLEQMDVIELNEAFAAQSLAVMRLLEMDPAKVNVNGGAIALGHPLGCTGAKLTATILHELQRQRKKYGLVTMCVGGGMGAAGIFENLQD
ncbi:MAG TPA: acetyl-CoA C-acyltransferase [Candidatus Dormibacteraeota bacterium]|nr:acetyl-CoA C-acyltransferase [Candidatus Dormibacteraeota bacterium]